MSSDSNNKSIVLYRVSKQEPKIWKSLCNALENIQFGRKLRSRKLQPEPGNQWYLEFEPLLVWLFNNRHKPHVIERFGPAVSQWVEWYRFSKSRISSWTLLLRLKHFRAGGSGIDPFATPAAEITGDSGAEVIPSSREPSTPQANLFLSTPENFNSKAQRKWNKRLSSPMEDLDVSFEDLLNDELPPRKRRKGQSGEFLEKVLLSKDTDARETDPTSTRSNNNTIFIRLLQEANTATVPSYGPPATQKHQDTASSRLRRLNDYSELLPASCHSPSRLVGHHSCGP
jgi:hypothetical protein